MADDLNRRWIDGKDLDELVAGLLSPQVGSQVHEQIKAAIQVEIAKIQRDAAQEAVQWAKTTAEATSGAVRWAMISAVGTAGATIVALVALAISLTR